MSDFTCACGRTYEIRQVGIHSVTTTRRDRRQTGQRFASEVAAIAPQAIAPDLQAGESVEIKTPVRAQSLEPDVVVPGLQALEWAAAVTLPVAALTIAVGWPWTVPPLTFATVTGLAYLYTSGVARALLMSVERYTGRDIDGDGRVGDAPQPIPVNFTRRQGTSQRTQKLLLPCPKVGEDALARWFWRVCREEGKRFSIRVGMGYGLTRSEAEDTQAYFLHILQAVRDKKTKHIIPTDEGLATMWGLVLRHYPLARLPPDDVPGVENTVADTRARTHTHEEG